MRTLKGYVHNLAGFTGEIRQGVTITSEMISSRVLRVGIPTGPRTATQQALPDSIEEYGMKNGVTVIFTELP